MLEVKFTSKMKRDFKRVQKRGKDMKKLYALLKLLVLQEPLPKKYQDHPLKGDMQGYRECHIEPNWLLIYQIKDDELLLLASGTGTHSDLFDD